jgi:hypothetical protein
MNITCNKNNNNKIMPVSVMRGREGDKFCHWLEYFYALFMDENRRYGTSKSWIIAAMVR